MKKLTTILLLLIASTGYSQYVVNVSGSGVGGNSDSALFANRADSLGITPASVIISNIASKYNLSDTVAAMALYKAKIIELTDSSISKTTQVNGLASTSVTHTSNIALKYNLADTAAAMNAYRLKIIELTDSSISKTAQVNGLASTSGTHTSNIATNASNILLKVNISDTATAMAGYKAKIIELTDSSVSKTAQVNGLATTSGTHTTNIAAAYTTKTLAADSSYDLSQNASGSKKDTTKYIVPGSPMKFLTGFQGDGYTVGTGNALFKLNTVNWRAGRFPNSIFTVTNSGLITEIDSVFKDVTSTTKTLLQGEGNVSTSTANAQIVYTLPATAYKGQVFKVVGGTGTGGWRISQNALQVIKFNDDTSNRTTTVGVTGYLQSANQYDCIEIICIEPNITFNVMNAQGAITVN